MDVFLAKYCLNGYKQDLESEDGVERAQVLEIDRLELIPLLTFMNRFLDKFLNFSVSPFHYW